jgi:hypothetical protein
VSASAIQIPSTPPSRVRIAASGSRAVSSPISPSAHTARSRTPSCSSSTRRRSDFTASRAWAPTDPRARQAACLTLQSLDSRAPRRPGTAAAPTRPRASAPAAEMSPSLDRSASRRAGRAPSALGPIPSSTKMASRRTCFLPFRTSSLRVGTAGDASLPMARRRSRALASPLATPLSPRSPARTNTPCPGW